MRVKTYKILTKSTHMSKMTLKTDTRAGNGEITMALKGDKTREFILDRSYALFASKGFKQVTM